MIADDVQNTNIVNSTIYAYTAGTVIFKKPAVGDVSDEFNAIGIMMGANSSLTVDHSNIYATTDVSIT